MGKPTTTFTATANRYIAELVNKIGRQEYASKTYSNPMASLKGGFIDNANDIEEIYVARLNGVSQNLDGTTNFDKKIPDVKSCYHKQNYSKLYTTTVTDKQVRQAFTTTGGVKTLSDEIIAQLHTGAQYDEYIAMRDNLKDIITRDEIKTVNISSVTDNASAKDFMKKLKTVVAKMSFRNKDFCTFETSASINSLILFVKPEMLAELDVELLASAFNVSAVDIKTRVFVVDTFGDETTEALLIDRNAFKVHPTLYNLETARNAQGMFTNYHLNVEYIISTSIMYNACLFTSAPGRTKKK